MRVRGDLFPITRFMDEPAEGFKSHFPAAFRGNIPRCGPAGGIMPKLVRGRKLDFREKVISRDYSSRSTAMVANF